MPSAQRSLKDIFLEALAVAPAERSAWLDGACADNAPLRRQLELMLAAHDNPQSLLDGAPPAGPPGSATESFPADKLERAGDVIGAYKLLEQIGEGGFGVVFLAEQTEPVRRKVALKVLKPGMDSRQVLARFEAERQALALMDHPNIARVFDGGATPAGRPYFVMELVKGVPVTEFCDQNHLSPRDRLRLFMDVCRAVQHAHQKGVIHRDLKPANVLVTVHDTTPVVKVIDFGVAKAVGQELTDKTLFTGFAQMVGTPLYMSPEQAGQSGLDVDTRSDVYSLGVLLYELLTGTTPFDKERFRKAGYDEIRRIIREEEPPRPSTRLSESTDSLSSISALRHTEPARLTRLVRGELDWIVMRALEKDRTRRYETANAFAMDIQRYLTDEPVQACPPSGWYRLRKLVRRNKGPALAAGVIAASLVAGVVGATWGLVRARGAERDARAAAAAERAANDQAQKRLRQIEAGNELLASVFRDLDPRAIEKGGRPLRAVLGDRLARAADQLDGEAVGDPLVVASLQHRLSLSLRELGLAERAIPIVAKARATRAAILGPDHPDTLASMNDLAMAYHGTRKLDQALPLMELTLAKRKERLGETHRDTLVSTHNLALVYLDANRTDDALRLFKHTLATLKEVGGEESKILHAMDGLAGAYQRVGRPEEAVPLFEHVLTRRREKLGDDNTDTLMAMNNLAGAHVEAGRIDRAIPHFEQAWVGFMKTVGPDHPDTIWTLGNLAGAYIRMRQPDKGLPRLNSFLTVQRKQLVADPLRWAGALNLIADDLIQFGQPAEAESVLRECLAIRREHQPHKWMTFDTESILGGCLLEQKKYADAAPLLQAGYDGLRQREKDIPPSHRPVRLVEALGRLVRLYDDWGKPDEAARWRSELQALTKK